MINNIRYVLNKLNQDEVIINTISNSLLNESEEVELEYEEITTSNQIIFHGEIQFVEVPLNNKILHRKVTRNMMQIKIVQVEWGTKPEIKEVSNLIKTTCVLMINLCIISLFVKAYIIFDKTILFNYINVFMLMYYLIMIIIGIQYLNKSYTELKIQHLLVSSKYIRLIRQIISIIQLSYIFKIIKLDKLMVINRAFLVLMIINRLLVILGSMYNFNEVLERVPIYGQNVTTRITSSLSMALKAGELVSTIMSQSYFMLNFNNIALALIPIFGISLPLINHSILNNRLMLEITGFFCEFYNLLIYIIIIQTVSSSLVMPS